MTVSLELSPDLEANLAARAQALGVPLDTYLRNLLETVVGSGSTLPPQADNATNSLRAALDSLAEMGRDLPAVPSSSFRRESIYGDASHTS